MDQKCTSVTVVVVPMVKSSVWIHSVISLPPCWLGPPLLYTVPAKLADTMHTSAARSISIRFVIRFFLLLLKLPVGESVATMTARVSNRCRRIGAVFKLFYARWLPEKMAPDSHVFIWLAVVSN